MKNILIAIPAKAIPNNTMATKINFNISIILKF